MKTNNNFREYIEDEHPELVDKIEKRFILNLQCGIERTKNHGVIWRDCCSVAFASEEDLRAYVNEKIANAVNKFEYIRENHFDYKESNLFVYASYQLCECLIVNTSNDVLDDILYSRAALYKGEDSVTVRYCDEDCNTPDTVYRTYTSTKSENTDTQWFARTRRV